MTEYIKLLLIPIWGGIGIWLIGDAQIPSYAAAIGYGHAYGGLCFIGFVLSCSFIDEHLSVTRI